LQTQDGWLLQLTKLPTHEVLEYYEGWKGDMHGSEERERVAHGRCWVLCGMAWLWRTLAFDFVGGGRWRCACMCTEHIVGMTRGQDCMVTSVLASA